MDLHTKRDESFLAFSAKRDAIIRSHVYNGLSKLLLPAYIPVESSKNVGTAVFTLGIIHINYEKPLVWSLLSATQI